MPHFDSAYRFARWLTRSVEDAEDLAQEAVLRAFRGFDTLRGSNARAWLLTIVRHCHATALRRAHTGTLVPLPADDASDGLVLTDTAPGPEGLTIEADQQRSLEHLLQRLPDDYREVLVLREVEDMNYREIAQVIGAPLGTVMSRLARARAALKRQWLQQHEGQPHVAP